MIPNENLFSGALGKVQNVGGSKFFTTPHTVDVKPNYVIDTGIEGKCLTCSLDGRLWLFSDNIAALKLNTDTGRFELAASKLISEEKFVTRGLDWIVTNKSIYLVTDEEPYIYSSSLNSSSAQRVLYSILRSKVLSETPRAFTTVAGPAIDPFTQATWGMNEDNGNSEGWAFFNTNNFLLYPENSHTMEQCYSILPKVGDWQIVENFLIRRPDSPLENKSQLAPLIPLEFNLYWLSRSVTYPTYGTGYNLDHRGIQLFIRNGELWGRGLMHVGRVFILPATFNEDGSVKDYYLYISPEYLLSPYNQRTTPNMDANNDWLNLAFISDSDNNLLGFLSEQNSGLCQVSSDGRILAPENNEWTSPVLNDEGKLILDTVNSSALFLGSKGMNFLGSGKSFECSALAQWVAPANQIESISDDLIISSFDNHTLATCIPTGFNRELLSQRKLSLSAKTFNSKKFSMGVSGGNITVNEVLSKADNIPDSIAWSEIYKPAVNIKLLNIISQDTISSRWNSYYPALEAYSSFTYDSYSSGVFNGIYYNINPDTGELEENRIEKYIDSSVFPVIDSHTYARFEGCSIIKENGTICAPFKVFSSPWDSEPIANPNYEIPVGNIINPEWFNTENLGLVLNAIRIPCETVVNAISNKLACCANAIFSEVSSNTKFVIEVPSLAKVDDDGNFSGLSQNLSLYVKNYGNINTYKKDYRNRNRTMSNLHVLILNATEWWTEHQTALIFRSEINSDIFDFDTELLRSNLS